MTELTQHDNNPIANIKQSTDVAGACKEIVSRSAIKIQGRKYVPVEGWMAIATAHGCNLSATDVQSVDGGISAKGIVRRISDGIILGEAEGFVGNDEKTWASRPMFARRAMAQTRAMSRAARSVFAHVVVLMDAGLETTPMEEMIDIEPVVASKPIEKEVKKPDPKPVAQTEDKMRPVFLKYKQAIGECIITINLNRFIEASKTFDKYVQKMDSTLFEEYDFFMSKEVFPNILHIIEDRLTAVYQNQFNDLLKIFPAYQSELKSAYDPNKATEVNTKQEEEETIF